MSEYERALADWNARGSMNEDEIAQHVAGLTADLAAARAERDGLAKALRGLLPGVDDAWVTFPEGTNAVAAALAALPPKEEA